MGAYNSPMRPLPPVANSNDMNYLNLLAITTNKKIGVIPNAAGVRNPPDPMLICKPGFGRIPRSARNDRGRKFSPSIFTILDFPPLPRLQNRHILYLVIFLVAVFARVLPGPRTIDDAYITFRYARNLLAGDGFVFNPGELVLGTTTPLYALLMAFLGLFSSGPRAPYPELALGLNALLDAFSCILIVLIGGKLGARWAGWAAALAWAVAPFSVTFAIGGLETSLVILLLLGIYAAYLHGRYTLTGLLSALALLARPDTAALILPLGFDRLFFDPKRRGVRLSAKELLAFFLPVLAWLAFSLSYFGTPIPNSIAAKNLAYEIPPLTAFVRFLQHYATPFMEAETFGIPAIRVGLVLYPSLYLLGALYAWRNSRANWTFIAYPWFYMAAFSIANPLIFRWYLTPPLPFYFIFVLIGAERLLTDLFSPIKRRAKSLSSIPYPLSFLPYPLLFVPFLFLLNAWQLHPDHGLTRPAPAMAWYKLELLYHQVAEELASEIAASPTRPVLAAGDVGALGYYTNAIILDTVGLMSPQTVAYYPLDPAIYSAHAYAVPPDLILDLQPDYFVTLEIYVRTGLLQDPRFAALYELRQKIPTDIYDSDGMLIFVRRVP